MGRLYFCSVYIQIINLQGIYCGTSAQKRNGGTSAARSAYNTITSWLCLSPKSRRQDNLAHARAVTIGKRLIRIIIGGGAYRLVQTTKILRIAIGNLGDPFFVHYSK